MQKRNEKFLLGGRRKVTDVNDPNSTYYIPKGVNRKRYGKYLSYRKFGGELGWEEFKKRGMYRKPFKSLWDGSSVTRPTPTGESGQNPIQDILNNPPADTGGPTDDLGPQYDPNQILPDDSPEVQGPPLPDGSFVSGGDANLDQILANNIKEIRDNNISNENLLQPETTVVDSTDMGIAQFNDKVWCSTIQEDYGVNGAGDMTPAMQFDLMYRVGVESYKDGGINSGRHKWENWTVYRPGAVGHENYLEAKAEIDGNVENFLQRYDVPRELFSQLVERFGGITEDLKIAAAIITAESHWDIGHRNINMQQNKPVEINQEDNTKKEVKQSDVILDKVKKKKKVDYNPNREVSTPRRKI